MDKVRFGVVGLGNMGSGHTRNLFEGKIPGAVLTAVCDIKPDRLDWARGICGEAAKKSGKAFGIMYNQRTNKLYQKMREMVKDGSLGELKRCVWIITDWYRTQAYYNSGGWRATWAGEGGGVLLNQCPHNLDLWQWIFGMPSSIYANCEYGKYHDNEV